MLETNGVGCRRPQRPIALDVRDPVVGGETAVTAKGVTVNRIAGSVADIIVMRENLVELRRIELLASTLRT
ncbi:MAG: hypothetical protein RLZZ444_580 [Pseudomonadota bacterium]